MSAPAIQFVGPTHNLVVFGVKLLGIDQNNGRKLLFTICFFAVLYCISKMIRAISHLKKGHSQTVAFWTRQGTSLLLFLLALLGFLSIWFDNPTRLSTGVGIVGAGLAFASQKVVTSLAGYFVILRGKTFNVGDRIRMGGVRGDVIALNFIQTVIMEMGEPPSVQQDDPGMWVDSRQYSGRIVTVSNSKIFEDPVYNYTRDFPFIWEEMHLPISYKDDYGRAEQILLSAAEQHTVQIKDMAEPQLRILKERFFIEAAEARPRVYVRLTDNWVELAVRFLVHEHGIRGVKDAMSRQILSELNAAGIGIASGTYEIVGFPPVQVRLDQPPAAPAA